MSRICVIGTGYVGLVTGSCLAELGHRVCGVDIDEAKIESLKRGTVPIFEPGLNRVVESNLASGRLRFTNSYAEGLDDAEFVFITVGTPPGHDGSADLRQVELVAQAIATNMTRQLVIVNKSTVPVGTAEWLEKVVRDHQPNPVPFAVVSNPEFLREGVAVEDFFSPARVVVGSTDRAAAMEVADLYAPLRSRTIVTDPRTSEMIKYASNAFLATKISFINEMANICEKVSADVCQVAEGMGLDSRIGPQFLNAGLGYGGSCFPKDVQALAQLAKANGFHPQLLHSVMAINRDQTRLVLDKLDSVLPDLAHRSIGVLGLAFKPNTDDVRESPAITVARLLHARGAFVQVYDPEAMVTARRLLPPETVYCSDPYEVANGADALIVATEWDEFKKLDMGRIGHSMVNKILIDGRNIFDPDAMSRLGFVYFGIGRAVNPRVPMSMAARKNGASTKTAVA